MKTIIVMLVVGIVAFFSIKSFIKSLRGEGGCSCSKSNNCSIKKSCPSKLNKTKK